MRRLIDVLRMFWNRGKYCWIGGLKRWRYSSKPFYHWHWHLFMLRVSHTLCAQSYSHIYLRQGGNVFTLFVCLSVCLLATLLNKFLTDFDEIFRITRQWYEEQLFKFWGWSGSPFRRSTGKCKILHFWQFYMGVLSGLQSVSHVMFLDM